MTPGVVARQKTSCQYHPERPGVGICIKCATVICTECSTRLDGINHCAVCVAKLRDERDHEKPPMNLALRSLALISMIVLVSLGGYAVFHMLLLW